MDGFDSDDENCAFLCEFLVLLYSRLFTWFTGAGVRTPYCKEGQCAGNCNQGGAKETHANPPSPTLFVGKVTFNGYQAIFLSCDPRTHQRVGQIQ
jgi:hypothetical protein